ncbi:MAG: transketolase C-terminal domain-containing protein, partial [Dokdonella sp.]
KELGWAETPTFLVPDDAATHFRAALQNGSEQELAWQRRWAKYAKAESALASELLCSLDGKLPGGWDSDVPVFKADEKGIATRVAGGKVLSAIAPKLPAITGGSADLDPSTHTAVKGLGVFSPGPEPDKQGAADEVWSFAGRNLHFGVREHAMGAIANGMAAHGGTIPYDATFLTFSDYMRPPLRLAALMGLHTIHVYTHDSIALGEDGPTHQPVEQIASLRAIPNLLVIRPGDANETAVAWKVAVEAKAQPVALIFSRQAVPTLDRDKFASAEGVRQGAYILRDADGPKPDLILIGTGTETGLVVNAADQLKRDGVSVRVVSMPSWELFEAQPQAYRDLVLTPAVTARLAVEAGISQGWERYVGPRGDTVTVDRFGASAPGDEVLEHYGFSVDNICAKAKALLRER